LNHEFPDEVLALVDGRNVYAPRFGGVLCDLLDLSLEGIGRIEVIRGPGAPIWGANAINGVINVITKNASETLGAMVVAGMETLDRGFGNAQYGGSLGKRTDFGMYSKYFNQATLPNLTGPKGEDDRHMLRGVE
jgi:iron complex outermembrane receptor protein